MPYRFLRTAATIILVGSCLSFPVSTATATETAAADQINGTGAGTVTTESANTFSIELEPFVEVEESGETLRITDKNTGEAEFLPLYATDSQSKEVYLD